MSELNLAAAIAFLADEGACGEALGWLRSLPAGATPREAFEQCADARWLLWLAGQLRLDRKIIVLATCACARTALPYGPEGDPRPLVAIETAEKWARGGATDEEVRAAVNDVVDAVDAADNGYAAAYAAAYAATAAISESIYAPTYAAAYASYAKGDTPFANYDLAYPGARAESLRNQAAIVRGIVRWEMVEATAVARWGRR